MISCDAQLTDTPLSDIPFYDTQLNDAMLNNMILSDNGMLSDMPLDDTQLNDVPLSDISFYDTPLTDASHYVESMEEFVGQLSDLTEHMNCKQFFTLRQNGITY